MDADRKVPGLEAGLHEFYDSIYAARGMSVASHHIPIIEGLEDERIRRFMVIIGPGSGKSTITTQAYPLWKIGRNPATTVVAVSGGEGLVQGFQQGMMEIIQSSDKWKYFFPDVEPDTKRGWSMQNGIFVTGRPPGDPDANMFSAGLTSQKLTGVHGREIIMDDLHNDENSATPEQCLKVRQKYYSLLLGRGDPRSARYILTGRRYNKEDIYGALISSGNWVVLRLPAERPNSFELWVDVLVPKMADGSPMPCVFSEQYEPEREQDVSKPYISYKAIYGFDHERMGFYWPQFPSKRMEYFEIKRNMPSKAEAVYQCNPDVKENPIFQDDDFIQFQMTDENGVPLTDYEVAEGVQNQKVRSYIERNDGTIIQSWDTAAGKSADSAYSVCVTAMLITYECWWRDEEAKDPDIGPCERHNRVYILDVKRAKLDFAELSRDFRIMNDRWRPQAVLVENRSTGISIIQSFKSSAIPIQSVEAKDGKVSRAIDAIGGAHASVQGWFRQHRVVLRTNDTWYEEFVSEFKSFGGTNATKKDQVDATVYLVAYAIRHGVGMARIPSDDILNSAGDTTPLSERGLILQGLQMLGETQYDTHPLAGCCARCFNWLGRSGENRDTRVEPYCTVLRRQVTMFDSCPEYRELGDGRANPGW